MLVDGGVLFSNVSGTSYSWTWT